MDLTVSLHRPRSRRQPDKPDMRKTVDRNFTGAAAGIKPGGRRRMCTLHLEAPPHFAAIMLMHAACMSLIVWPSL
ncbi:hypothetical protein JQ607_18630 [Bradyrhizobium liaoningense]|uniref:hypothetical protein n=1 Tax=Bradyrhizobium liaoningense TaxID=43992 RepID=UPI001BA52B07|nr:hypothetical protein [Bradyrhizobium liaoningense]MBR0842219.1 hypothetical protein [Bradyrhizobium liaoningense]